jgi:lipase chaperone LimK
LIMVNETEKQSSWAARALHSRLAIKTTVAISVTFAAIFIISLGVFKSDQRNTNQQQRIVSTVVTAEQAKSINAALHQQPVNLDEEALASPESIAGLDYALSHLIDDQGHLVPSRSIRHMFDSYLSALNETDLESIIKLIQAEINETFSEPARSDALSLLKRYLDYKIDLIDFEEEFSTTNENGSDLERIIASQLALKEFRTDFFNHSEYESFFEEDDAHNAFMIEQMRINQNDQLNTEEKAQKLDQALNLLPESSIQSRKRMLSHTQLRTEVKQIRARGGNEQDVFAAREQALGAQAAIDLRELDEQRVAWQNKLSTFAQARNQVRSSSMTESDQNSAIETLLSEQFEASEQKRVIALMNDGRLN